MEAMDHGSHLAIHLVAAVVLLTCGSAFIVASWFQRSIAPSPGRQPHPVAAVGRSIALILAALSGGAAVIHLAAAPGHYGEIGDLATGFLVAAVFQGVWARAVLGGLSRRTVAWGIAGNAALVVAWAYTRMIGLPIGEFAGRPEPVGVPDAASVAFELLLIAGLIVTGMGVHIGPTRRSAARTLASIAVVPVVGLVVVMTSLSTVAIASGMDHGMGSGVSADHDHAGVQQAGLP